MHVLRLNDNPVEKKNPRNYRKAIIIALDDLVELDKIKVVQAERLCYKGLLPHMNGRRVEEMLERFKNERDEIEAKEKMEFELYVEMMDEKGVTQKERINKNLDAYANMDKE